MAKTYMDWIKKIKNVELLEEIREKEGGTYGIVLDTKTDLTRDYESVLQSITREDTRRIIQQMMNQQNHYHL